MEQSAIDFLGSRASTKGKAKKGAAGKKTGADVKEVDFHNDDNAADIVLNFKRFKVCAGDVRAVKKWGRQSNKTVTYPIIPPKEAPFITPSLKFNIPSLPIEPETPYYAPQHSAKSGTAGPSSTGASAAVISPSDFSGPCGEDVIQIIGNKRKIYKPKPTGKGQDEWWPSNESIRKERRKRGDRQDEEDTDDEAEAYVDSLPNIGFVKSTVDATKERLAKSVEPGVLEKIPHCKLWDDHCKEKKAGSGDHQQMFCCQTTETFPYEVMVCCSVCSTWRHAQCGGHHKRYTPDSVDPANVVFKPVCDQCYIENHFVKDNEVASARLERQRIEHVRRSNATNAVMRQVAFGKHSGQYKWPLGSVSVSHISGHTRSVQARHEKAEKQWKEMALRLGGGTELKARERQRVRTREFERILVSIEDAGKFCHS